MKQLIVSLSIIAVLACLSQACATTSGSSYERSASGESSALARAKAAKEARDSDDDENGKTTKPTKSTTSSASSSFSLFVIEPEIEEYVGWLKIEDLPNNYYIRVDGSYSGANNIALSPGQHHLSVEAFGYEDFNTHVNIGLDRTTTVRYVGKALAFRLYDLAVSSPIVERDQLGSFSWLGIKGRATAPTTLGAEIVDEAGRLVRVLVPIAISDQNWQIFWDGRDSEGALPPSGPYTVRFYHSLFTHSLRGYDSLTADDKIIGEVSFNLIAGRSPQRASSQFNGLSGGLFAPDARTLPAGHFEIGLTAIGHVASEQGQTYGRLPFLLATRWGIDLGAGAELAIGANYTLSADSTGTDTSSAGASAAFKMTLLRSHDDAWAAGAWLRVTLNSFVDEAAGGWPTPWDGASKFPGLGGGLVAEAMAGPVRFYAGADVAAASFYPNWDDDRYEVPGLFAWAYLRAGSDALIGLGSAGNLVFRISGALRTDVSYQSFKFNPPYLLGTELQWYTAHGRFIPSLISLAEIESPERYFIYGGVALNLVF